MFLVSLYIVLLEEVRIVLAFGIGLKIGTRCCSFYVFTYIPGVCMTQLYLKHYSIRIKFVS